jgi:unsaturated chondroitin disaccharide hydrolase
MNTMLKQHQPFIDDVWGKIENKLNTTSERIKDTMPYTTKAGIYNNAETIDISWWTNSFWSGILWLMYQETKQESYRTYAESIEKKMDACLFDFDGLHHDVGFMWLATSVMNYTQTGNQQSRKRGMLAASTLSSRANIRGSYIRAWNNWTATDDNRGRAIIDCMMNVPLLYWASQQTGDERFSYIGKMHADKTMEAFVRPDGSVNHIVDFDPTNGAFINNPAGQGYASGSSWSRGQAWAVNGFAQSYYWTKEERYLDTAKKIAHYILSNLALTDYIVPCDYRQPKDAHLLDSSAAAITACGLIDIAKAVPENEQTLYLEGALSILKALDKTCAIYDNSDEALLTNGTSQFHLNQGIWEVENGALIYGDYYYLEAICKLKDLLRTSL